MVNGGGLYVFMVLLGISKSDVMQRMHLTHKRVPWETISIFLSTQNMPITPHCHSQPQLAVHSVISQQCAGTILCVGC